jgi:hypothetical protein
MQGTETDIWKAEHNTKYWRKKIITTRDVQIENKQAFIFSTFLELTARANLEQITGNKT